ncbi:MAG TPA: hypothetical protein VGB85_31355 [Nannocystis sp.]|jgi:hypothetical protein
MKLMHSVGGAVAASVLACGGEGASTTDGSSSGTATTGNTSTTGGTTGDELTTTSSTTAPTTADDTSTTDAPTTGETSTTSVTTDTSSTTDVSSSSSGGEELHGCEGSMLAICEDFEDADDGAFPDGWGARGDEWGEGVIGVASDGAHDGVKALKIDGGNNGQHFMDYKGDLGGLASHHYGRVFLKVAIPAPWPADGVLHADFIEGLGPGPGGSKHNVRWGVVENTNMTMQWIYNVQPSNGDPEFAEGTPSQYTWSGEWQCMEWFYDEPSQHGTLWIDGLEMPIVPGKNHAAEIPVFTSLGVGLANYQNAGEGFTVWFDDLAYDPERIGCEL